MKNNTTNTIWGKNLEKVTGGSSSGIVCAYCGVIKGQHNSAACAKSPMRVHIWLFKPDIEPVES